MRHQLAVYKPTATRPRLRTTDRLCWVRLARVWAEWRQPLVIVTPDTVLRWQRRRFREHWTKLSGRPVRGRPPVDAEIIAFGRKMAAANPLRGAPRIHGELLKLVPDVAERTVSSLLQKPRTPPSQTWRTFLTNHVHDVVRSLSRELEEVIAIARDDDQIAREGVVENRRVRGLARKRRARDSLGVQGARGDS